MANTIKDTEGKLLSVSQSLVKNYWAYRNGDYCGIALHLIDILKEKQKEPTERMHLGLYFEYLCTGVLSRDGSTPEMPATKGGKPTAAALRMQEHAKRFDRLIKKEGITIEETGVVLEYFPEGANFKMKGVLDIRGHVEGIDSIVDIKSSGLIGDEWKEYGWHKGTFNMRKQLTIQVVFYKYLAWKVYGIKDMPFYFIVHSSTNDIDSLYWRVDVADFEVAMNHLEDMIFEIAKEIELEKQFGFTPYPSVKRCGECPLSSECEHSVDTPIKEVLTIDGIFE